MNTSQSPKAIEDCHELLLWMIPVMDGFPRNRRFTLGERIENRLLLVLEALVSAAYSREKQPLLQQANQDLELLRHLWRLCFEMKLISTKKYEIGSRLLLNLGRQVGGWLKSKK